MARGETDGPPPRVGGALVVASCVGLLVLGSAAALLRSWHVDRPLLTATDVALRRRGNAFGSHCELVRTEHDVRVPWSCGANASWPAAGEDERVFVVEDMNLRSCAVALDTLDTLGCVDGWVDWAGVSAHEVGLVSRRWDPAIGAERQWVAFVDRRAHTTRTLAVPFGALLALDGGRWHAQAHRGTATYELDEVSTDPEVASFVAALRLQ